MYIDMIHLLAADANKDGVVDLKDATLISRYYAGYDDAIIALTM